MSTVAVEYCHLMLAIVLPESMWPLYGMVPEAVLSTPTKAFVLIYSSTMQPHHAHDHDSHRQSFLF